MMRVIAMTVIATLLWTPVGVWIGFQPGVARFAQPLAQIGASFPVNMTFPVVVGWFVATHISINWGSILLIAMGTQWYILFNVVAGAMAIPNDLKEAARVYGLRRWDLWRTLILPAIFPFWVTGACTAAGGAWECEHRRRARDLGQHHAAGRRPRCLHRRRHKDRRDAADHREHRGDVPVCRVDEQVHLAPPLRVRRAPIPTGLIMTDTNLAAATPAVPVAELCAVSKSYKTAGGHELKVLENIDLAVRPGELLALLGQSGSGKSTILRCLTGLVEPTSGRALGNGELLHGINPDVSIVFQTFALYPWLTVEQNVAGGPDVSQDGPRCARRRRGPRHRLDRTGQLSRGLPARIVRRHAPTRGHRPCARVAAPRCCAWTKPSARWTCSPPRTCARS